MDGLWEARSEPRRAGLTVARVAEAGSKEGKGRLPLFPFDRPPPGPMRRWRLAAIRRLFSRSVVRNCRQAQCEAGQSFDLGFC